jgi:DNA-binding MarR family transcriptional regulator
MTISATTDEGFPAGSEAELVEVLQSITRVLVGVALRSIDVLGEAVSLPQFRLLAVLADLGPTRSGRVARALDLEPSTITRLADRLAASGHITRQGDPLHRGVVTLALTQRGTELVEQVARWRRAELGRLAARLASEDRVIATRTLRRMVDEAGPGYGNVIVGLMGL